MFKRIESLPGGMPTLQGNRKSLSLIPLLLVFALLTVTGCDKTEDTTTAPTLSAQDLVMDGWVKYEDSDWNGALSSFNAAIAENGSLSDAWNGAGWAEGQIPGQLVSAANRFAVAFQKDTTRYDALGGWAFVEFQRNNLQSAINKSDSLLARRPRWKFLHEQQLDYLDLQLLQSKAYFLLGIYADSYKVVVDHLNPGFSTDISTPFGRQQLSDEIERLERIYG